MNFDTLIHNVNAKCSSMKEAAAFLRKSSPAQARELGLLMAKQARSLAEDIASAERKL